MDGFEVCPMEAAVKQGDVFITVTGDTSVVRKEHFLAMKDRAIVANSGHFDVEIDMEALRKICGKSKRIRECVEEFVLPNKRRVYVIAEGRLVNLGAAEGHPAMVMDMSFANQALSAEWVARTHEALEKKVYKVPEDIDKEIARIKLGSMGVSIDTLTPKQKQYLSAWEIGT